jgi:hypothetical protein
MSGSQFPGTGMPVGPEDIEEQLSLIEEARAALGPGDEYLEAILQNTQVMTMMMAQQSAQVGPSGNLGYDLDEDGSPRRYPTSSRPVPVGERLETRDVPVNSIGIANQTIYENDFGPATFQVEGTVFSQTVRVTDTVASGDPLRVVAPGNITKPVNDVALNLLGLPGQIGVDTYERTESPSKVEIQPGERKPIITVPMSGSVVSVGSTDETFSEYHYLIDGEELNRNELLEPLGLYNDPYRFPTPLAVGEQFRVEVQRTADAADAAEYISKVTYYE